MSALVSSAPESTPAPAAPPLQTGEALRFALTLVVILAPFLVCFGGLEAIAWQIGETWSMNHVVQWQDHNPKRMWRGGDGRSYLTYKVARVLQLKPEVVMLGQSRANFFTARMFQPYSFYNSEVTAWTFEQYLRYLQIITADGYAPRVLFFNLDYWMFNDEFDRAWDSRFYERPPTHWEDLKIVVDSLTKNPRGVLERLFTAKDVKGIYAFLHGDGFRLDGSLDQTWVPDSNPERITNDTIHVGRPPAVFGDKFDPKEMAAFERFVEFAKSKNISLVGIQVPFHAKILDALNSWSGLWRKFRGKMGRDYLEGKGVLFFDFADMPEYRDRPERFTELGPSDD